MDDLKPCKCGGAVMHLIRNEEKSIIECQKCGQVTDIEKLWNESRNKPAGQTANELGYCCYLNTVLCSKHTYGCVDGGVE